MKGLWEKHYADELSRLAYGDTTTYYRGAMWLNTCASIEDWGCGLGYFKTCCMFPERVVGIDGSWSRFADKIADLMFYMAGAPWKDPPEPYPEGIFMRHVLEHNLEWRPILANAARSFTKRMCLVVFTPFNEEEASRIIGHTDMGSGRIPDVSLRRDWILDVLAEAGVTVVKEETLKTKTQYGEEHVFYLEKS